MCILKIKNIFLALACLGCQFAAGQYPATTYPEFSGRGVGQAAVASRQSGAADRGRSLSSRNSGFRWGQPSSGFERLQTGPPSIPELSRVAPRSVVRQPAASLREQSWMGNVPVRRPASSRSSFSWPGNSAQKYYEERQAASAVAAAYLPRKR